MSLDKSLGNIALKLISKYGKVITLSSIQQGSYNPSTGSANDTVVTQDISGVIEEYADSIRFLGDKSQASSSVVEGDKKITVARQGLVNIPKVSDSVSVGGIIYNIQGVASMYSGELVAAYALHVRKK